MTSRTANWCKRPRDRGLVREAVVEQVGDSLSHMATSYLRYLVDNILSKASRRRANRVWLSHRNGRKGVGSLRMLVGAVERVDSKVLQRSTCHLLGIVDKILSKASRRRSNRVRLTNRDRGQGIAERSKSMASLKVVVVRYNGRRNGLLPLVGAMLRPRGGLEEVRLRVGEEVC